MQVGKIWNKSGAVEEFHVFKKYIILEDVIVHLFFKFLLKQFYVLQVMWNEVALFNKKQEHFWLRK